MATISDFLVLGNVYIIEQPQTIAEDIKQPQTISHAIKSVQEFKNKLKNDVASTVTPGIVKRPSAGELMAKDEPEIKKEADKALLETLDAIPELRKAKEYFEEQQK